MTTKFSLRERKDLIRNHIRFVKNMMKDIEKAEHDSKWNNFCTILSSERILTSMDTKCLQSSIDKLENIVDTMKTTIMQQQEQINLLEIMREDHEKLKALYMKRFSSYPNFQAKFDGNSSDSSASSIDWEPSRKKMKICPYSTDEYSDTSDSIEQAEINQVNNGKDEILKKLLTQLCSGNIENRIEFLNRFKSGIGEKAFDLFKENIESEINKRSADIQQSVSDVNSNSMRVIRGSWNQADSSVFSSLNAGKQCCAMALAFIVYSKLSSPSQWSMETINEIMIEGNDLYQSIVKLSLESNLKLPESGFLNVQDFDLLLPGFEVFAKPIKLNYDKDPAIYGCLSRIENEDSEEEDNGAAVALFEGFQKLFAEHSSGILIFSRKSFAVIKSSDKFYFCDSHDSSAFEESSKMLSDLACMIECGTLEELCNICMKAADSEIEPYTLDFVSVEFLS